MIFLAVSTEYRRVTDRPFEAATTTLSVITSRSYTDASPGVHFKSPGQLQLPAVQSDRLTHTAYTVGAE